MSTLYLVLAAVALWRIAELFLAKRNTARLRAKGAIEYGARHYPLFVVLHSAWLLAMALTISPYATVYGSWLIAFALLQIARVWVLWTLGERWTTRVLVLPDAEPIRHGPYRFVDHPNYLIVIAEIAVLPMAFGALWLAVIFSALNAALLAYRIRIEEQALRQHAPHASTTGATP